MLLNFLDSLLIGQTILSHVPTFVLGSQKLETIAKALHTSFSFLWNEAKPYILYNFNAHQRTYRAVEMATGSLLSAISKLKDLCARPSC